MRCSAWGGLDTLSAEPLQQLDRYYTQAVPAIQAIRSCFAPHVNPIDALRLQLDEQWPTGAHVERLDGERGAMMVGLVRVIPPHKTVLAHQDHLDWDMHGSPLFAQSSVLQQPLAAQLTANVYLQMPAEGGELCLWSSTCSRAEYDDLSDGDYGVRDAEAKLGPPDVVLRPEVGELILFNSNRFHSIRKGSEERVSISSFIGYRGTQQPLTMWS